MTHLGDECKICSNKFGGYMADGAPASGPSGRERAENNGAAGAIASALQGAIQRGDYPLGASLPTEAALGSTYDASRYAVRQALARLTRLGLIERRQGSGSVVRARAPRVSYAQSMGSLDELLQYAKDTTLTVDRVRLESIAARTARAIGRDAGETWLHASGLRHSVNGDTAPIAWTDVYINERFAAVADRMKQETTPVYRLIEEQYGATVEQVEQEITAIQVGSQLARRLGVAPNDPALQVTRRYLSADGTVLAVAINVHPGTRFRYAMVLNRSVGS